MPLVRIDMWKGRGREVKDALIRNVTRAVVEAVGCPADAVEILIFEVDKADWAKGGVSHAELQP
jgi:4-oxalocrotonate tautomerase